MSAVFFNSPHGILNTVRQHTSFLSMEWNGVLPQTPKFRSLQLATFTFRARDAYSLFLDTRNSNSTKSCERVNHVHCVRLTCEGLIWFD